MGIAGLLLNILVFPGLGSIICKTKNAVPILVLSIISIPLMLVLVGFITGFVAWVWALVDSIQYLTE